MRTQWTNLERTWLWMSVGLFLTTGLAKLHAGLVHPESLPGAERVFGVPLIGWSLGLGTLETSLAVVLLGIPRFDLACRCLRLVFTGILGYRVLLEWEGGGPCACLGQLLARTPLQEREGLLLWSVAIAAALANECALYLHHRRLRRAITVPTPPAASHART